MGRLDLPDPVRDEDIAELLPSARSRSVEAPVPRLRGRRGYNVLSKHELDVLQLAANGFRDAEIAEQLGRSEHTVKSQMRACMWQLDAASRTHAVALGIRQRQIS